MLPRLMSHKNVQRFRESNGLFIAFTVNNKNFRMRIGNLDHKMPVSNGGTNNFNNLVLSCATCNYQRHATGHVKTFEEYMDQVTEWCECNAFTISGSTECGKCRHRRKNAAKLICGCGRQKHANRDKCGSCAREEIEYYI